MINFYNQQELYFRVELKMVTFGHDPRMQSLMSDLDRMTVKYNQDAKMVIQASFTMAKFVQSFLSDIYELQQLE